MTFFRYYIRKYGGWMKYYVKIGRAITRDEGYQTVAIGRIVAEDWRDELKIRYLLCESVS